MEIREVKKRKKPEKRRNIEGKARLLNLSRAAELLGLAYDTVAKAAEEKDLEVAFSVEGAKGRMMPVVTIEALNAYRHRAIARLSLFSSDYHKDRAKALAEKVLA